MMRWELFKLRKRWMPWVLLAIAVGISQLFLWGFFIAYQNDDIISESSIGYSVENEDGEHEFLEFSCDDILDDRKLDSQLVRLPEDQRADARSFAESSREECIRLQEAQLKDWSREIFVLPSSLANGLGFIQSIAVFALTILAVSSMGVEYGWGTLRTALTRGTGPLAIPGRQGPVARVDGGGRASLPVARARNQQPACRLAHARRRPGPGRFRRVVHRRL